MKKTNNPVAKHARTFNKAVVMTDRKKAQKKGDRKHKGKYQEDTDVVEDKKGLWDRIHAKRKRGEKPAKPGDKDYPKTLDVGEGKNTPNDGNPCWDTHKKVGTKMKGGKRVNDCVPKNENVEEGMYKTGNRGSRKLGNRSNRQGPNRDKYGPVDYDAKKAKTRRKIDHLKHKRELDKLNKDFDYDFDEARFSMKKKRPSAQDRFNKRLKTKHGIDLDANQADYKRMMDKLRSIDSGLPKKESVEQVDELTQKDKERLAARKKKNLIKRGKLKPEPKKPRQAGAGRVSNVGAGKEEASDNVIMQLRKSQDLKGRHDIKFRGGEIKLPINLVNKLLDRFDKIQKPADKKKFVTMVTHELRKKAGLKDKPKATSSDKAMDKFNKSRKRGISVPRGKGSGPSDKELRDIDRGK